MTRRRLIALVLIASSLSTQALASDCADARERYNQAVDDVSYALRRYASCISSSDGTDDCSMEFRRLKNAHDDLESAVGEIGSYCEY